MNEPIRPIEYEEVTVLRSLPGAPEDAVQYILKSGFPDSVIVIYEDPYTVESYHRLKVKFDDATKAQIEKLT